MKRKDGFNEKMLWQIDGKKAVEEQEDGGVLFTHDIDDETPKINIIMNNDSSKKLDENESVVNWDDI